MTLDESLIWEAAKSAHIPPDGTRLLCNLEAHLEWPGQGVVGCLCPHAPTRLAAAITGAQASLPLNWGQVQGQVPRLPCPSPSLLLLAQSPCSADSRTGSD